jgi:hypothetical protein
VYDNALERLLPVADWSGVMKEIAGSFGESVFEQVEPGSRQEKASKQEARAPFRFNRNGKGSSEWCARFALHTLRSERVADQSDLPDGQKTQRMRKPVQPSPRKYFASRLPQIKFTVLAVPHP